MDGIAASARRAVASLAEIGATRLELAATEVEIARLRLARQGFALLVAFFCAGLALVFGAVAFALALAPADRPLALAVFAALAALGAALAWWWWRRLVDEAEPLLGATLAELRKDRAALAGGAREDAR